MVVEAAQILKQKDAERFAPVIRLMLAKEKRERQAEAKPRARKYTVLNQFGKPAKGGKTRDPITFSDDVINLNKKPDEAVENQDGKLGW